MENYKDHVFYILNKEFPDEITFEEFIQLEQTAAIENELMQHKLFLVFRIDPLKKVVTSLN